MKGGISKAGSKNDDRLPVKQHKGKKTKDPNKPKRPPSDFFVFMEDFRKKFKEKNYGVRTFNRKIGKRSTFKVENPLLEATKYLNLLRKSLLGHTSSCLK